MIRNKWAALLCGYLLFIASAVAFFQFPPLIDQINADIPLSDLDIGLIQGFYALPAVLLALVGGFVVDSIDSRISGILSGILLLAGNLLFVLGGSVVLMLAGRLIVGVATIAINLLAARMITIWFPRHQRGISMSIFHTAWPISAGLSFSFFVDAGEALGWQTLLLYVSVFIALTVVLFILFAPSDPKSAIQEPEETANRLKRITALPADLWKTAFGWFFFTGSMIGVLTFGAKHLQSIGFSYKTGSLWVGFLMLMAIPGSLIAGFIMDRLGTPRSYMIITPLITGAFLMFFALGQLPWLMMILAGLSATFIPIAVYAMPGELVGPRRLGVAFGVILTFSNIGNSASPILLGWINQVSGNYHLGLYITAGMMVAVALIALNISSRKPVELPHESEQPLP